MARAIDLDRRAEFLKERVYITFSALAVALTLEAEADHLRPGSAALTLTIAVLGTLLAVFVADFVAHVTVHGALPTPGELRHLAAVSLGSLGVLVLPLLAIAAAAAGLVALPTALAAAIAVLVTTLVVVGFLAVRRLRLPLLQRLVVLLAEFALGLAVIGLEVLAH